MTGRVRTVDPGPPFDHIEIDLQNALLAKKEFGQRHQCELRALAEDGTARSEEQILYELLRKGGTSAYAAAFHIVFGSDLDCVPVEPMVPVAEFVLGKQRILELYLNVVEWGPGIYGAESACRTYDRTAARNIGREQAARLAAILPLPLKRRPERMNHYSAIVLERMRQMGW